MEDCPKEKLVEIPVNKFIDNLKDCPICRQSLKNDKPLSNGAHLVNHFKDKFKDILNLRNNENPKYKCPTCKQELSDSMALMLHYGEFLFYLIP